MKSTYILITTWAWFFAVCIYELNNPESISTAGFILPLVLGWLADRMFGDRL